MIICNIKKYSQVLKMNKFSKCIILYILDTYPHEALRINYIDLDITFVIRVRVPKLIWFPNL